MNAPGKKAVLIGMCGFLALISAYAFINRRPAYLEAIPDIANMLPQKLPGWSSEDLPVGETEEVKRMMDQILNYDNAIFREYKKGFTKVQVYISYWTPGKAHFRLVYGHTPDICWVNGGWKPIVQDPAYHYVIGDTNPIYLKVGQYREFEFGHENTHVLFWQLLDGEPFTYGNYGIPPATAIFTDILDRGFDQKPEQWFIRISANVPFDRLKNDSGFEMLMRAMTKFGL